MTTATMPDPTSAEGRAILEAIRQETAAAVRSALLAALGVDAEPGRATDADGEPSEPMTIAPSSIEAIEASLVQDIYNARRLARLRILGLEPVPEPSAEALELLRRARQAAVPA